MTIEIFCDSALQATWSTCQLPLKDASLAKTSNNNEQPVWKKSHEQNLHF